MPESFDPYYKWLGIPPAQQPPHHYRLLGIELFESDVEVIDMAANQRMSYLQEMAGGTHGKESQRLLNEVSSARRCLLDKSAKAAYDEQLRAKAPKPATVVTESGPPGGDEDDTVNVSPTVNVALGKLGSKSAKTPPTKSAAPASESDSAFNFKVDGGKGSKTGKSKLTVTKSTPSKSTSSKAAGSKTSTAAVGGESTGSDSGRRRKKKSRFVPLALAVVALAGAGAGGYEYYRRTLAPKEESPAVAVATAPAATPTSTDAPPANVATPTPSSTAALTVPSPSASPSSSAGAAALEMFTSALKSQSPTETQSPAGAPAASAKPSPSAAKSPIVAAAEARPAAEFFLGAAPPNAASPGIHLQPQRNVLGRLVGFFKSGAEYHLFYESVSIARRAASEPWGHAVSSDLLSWREVPLAAASDPKRPAAIGSIFVDAENASGLGEAGKPVWLAACTFPDAKKAEIGYASSLDQGATWTFAKEPLKFEGGLPAEARWPRIVRDAERKQWCLVVWSKQVAKPASATYALFTSPNLKTWTKKQDIPLGNGSGAPDLFEIAEPSPGKARRWIFAAGNGRYMLGQFDGERFTSDNRGGQVFGAGYRWFRTLDDSAGETRRLATAVIAAPDSAKQAAHGSGAAVPLVFTLAGGESAPTLTSTDCEELQGLAGKSTDQAAGDLPAGAPVTVSDCGPMYRFTVIVEAGKAEAVEISLFGEKIRFDFKAKTQTIDGETTPYEAASVQLQGIVDREIAELRTAAGRVALSTSSGPGVVPFKLDAIGGTAKLQAVRVAPLVRPAGKP